MVNNLNAICQLLDFKSEDNFYFLQIIQRKKENPQLSSNSKVIKVYYISSITYLEEHMAEIMTLCKLFNARACISLNVKSYKKVALQNLKEIANLISEDHYKLVKNAYTSAIGSSKGSRNKTWIIDYDKLDSEDIISIIMPILNKCEPISEETKVKAILPTKNGFHIITTGFNIETFNKLLKDINYEEDLAIHKDNPTILYIPDPLTYEFALHNNELNSNNNEKN